MRTSIYHFLLALILIAPTSIHAQKSDRHAELRKYEDTLKTIAPEILYGSFDFNKYEASENFYNILYEALSLENSFTYPFDSLKTISILKSDNNFMRIFTWNLRKTDGNYDYFGIIQLNPKKVKGALLYKLTNNTNKSPSSINDVLLNDMWYGAHYYKLIQKKGKDNTYYTLLGWDGSNGITTRKIIDVLIFDAHGQPEFGTPIFNTHNEIKTRHIIEYASHVSVSLKYEKHYLYQGKNKKWMLIFDRVSPLTPVLEGQYQFYVPDVDTYDAFIFEDGEWFLYEDVDARNPKTDKKALKKKLKELEKKKIEQKK